MKSLVIVDDDALTRKVVQHLGQQCGFRTEGFASARTFLDQEETEEERLIVLDVVMPDQDGLEVLRILSERSCRHPILLLSGYSADYLKLASSFAIARGLSIAGILEKPVSNEAFRSLFVRLAGGTQMAEPVRAA